MKIKISFLKKFFPILFVLIISNKIILSQDFGSEFPAYNSLRTPTSPAFTVLGVEPNSVERPNTPSSLALSLKNISSDFKSLANDFALEVSPYWLMGAPTLTWREDANRNLFESISRTFTVSVATAEVGGDLFPSTGLATGIRMSLVSGTLSSEARKNLEMMEMTLTKEAKIFASFQEKRRKDLDSKYKEQLKENEGNWKKIEDITYVYNSAVSNLNQLILEDPDYQDSVDAVREKVQQYAIYREGFFLDLAAAAEWNFDNGIVDKGKFGRVAIWLTPSFVSHSFSFSAVARYFHYGVGNDNIDYGARLTFTKSKYAFSFEGLGRSALKSAPSSKTEYKGDLSFDYEALKGIWLNLTFGKEFNSSDAKSLIASAGVNFNFNSQRFSAK